MRPIKAIVFEPSCLADTEGPFEDVAPALTELKAMGIQLATAVTTPPITTPPITMPPITTPSLQSRDREGAVTNAAANETLYITDNAEGLSQAKASGMIPILLMHDPDEAMRLVANNPAGAIVSLLELPDFIRLVAAQFVAAQKDAEATPLPSPLLSAP